MMKKLNIYLKVAIVGYTIMFLTPLVVIPTVLISVYGLVGSNDSAGVADSMVQSARLTIYASLIFAVVLLAVSTVCLIIGILKTGKIELGRDKNV